MPDLGEIKTYSVGFWQSQLCDNSLAGFPSDIDPSWGIYGFIIDGVNEDNFVEAEIYDEYGNLFKTIKFTDSGKKQIDISQFSNISSTQDVKVVIKITTYI